MDAGRERWKSNFSEWFHEILDGASIADYRYPIKGCGVWLPYGFKLREGILTILRRILNETGHEEVLFPLLITDKMLRTESEHIGSFESQTFWVTRAGDRKLDEEMALRPTSETAIAPMLKLWIRSHADLPKKFYQIVSVFRYETRATKPLMRVREVTTFKEAHTCHQSLEEAEEQVRIAVRLYSQFFDELGLPYIVSRRPEWDKFAGAIYSIAFDTILPDGRVLQIGTAHNLGQNFSKAFDVSFETEGGKREFVYQTSYGVSERVVAAVIAIHGDDRGLVLPPKIAPVQVVVIPIPKKGGGGGLVEKCKEVGEVLRRTGLRTEVDLREKLTPGAKYYEWERKGVPVRVEIGERELQESQLTVVRRDTLERMRVNEIDALASISHILSDVGRFLKDRAALWLRDHLSIAEDLEETKRLIEERGGIVELGWCGSTSCGLAVEEKVDAKVLGTALNKASGKRAWRCVVCGQVANSSLRVARTY
ncbi:MAG: proline--tRNA ligase [Candidatus Bathyarchaeia archaeon]